MTDDEHRENAKRYMLMLRRAVPEDAEIEILAATPILWSGWEGDHDAVLYRILPAGEPRLFVLGQMTLHPRDVVETLEERLAAYAKAIVDTKAFA